MARRRWAGEAACLPRRTQGLGRTGVPYAPHPVSWRRGSDCRGQRAPTHGHADPVPLAPETLRSPAGKPSSDATSRAQKSLLGVENPSKHWQWPGPWLDRAHQAELPGDGAVFKLFPHHHHGGRKSSSCSQGSRPRAPPYLARQMSRVETWTPGVTDVQLPDLFGSGVREGAAS
jgi:hypothetical protein